MFVSDPNLQKENQGCPEVIPDGEQEDLIVTHPHFHLGKYQYCYYE